MRVSLIAGLALSVTLFCGPVIAQEDAPPRRGEGQPPPQRSDRPQRFERRQQLTPEQREAAWKLQADALAVELNLPDEQADKMLAVYVDARKSHLEETNKLREKMREEFQERMRERREGGEGEEGGDDERGRGGRGAFASQVQEQMETVNKAHREKLKAALTPVLEGETLDRAFSALGTFDFRWDNMVHAVDSFNLNDESQYVVLWAVQSYVVATADARASADSEEDRQEIMRNRREARDEFNKSVEGILSEEQVRQLQRSMGRGGRFDRGGDGG